MEAVRQPRAASCGSKEWSSAELGRRGTSRSKRAAAQCISVAFDAVFPHSFSAFWFFVLQRERENEQEEEKKIKSRKYFCNF